MYDKTVVLSQNMEELSHTRRRISKTLADWNAPKEDVAQARQALAWVEDRQGRLERLHVKQCRDFPFQVCTKCGKSKPIDNSSFGFGFRHGSPKSQCKACLRASNAASHAANPELGRRRAGVNQAKRPQKFVLSDSFKVLLRAAQADSCAYCGCDLGGLGELDHWIPIELGGEDSRWNLVWACRGCNRDKGRKMPMEFKAVLVANDLEIRKGGFFPPLESPRDLRLAAIPKKVAKRT